MWTQGHICSALPGTRVMPRAQRSLASHSPLDPHLSYTVEGSRTGARGWRNPTLGLPAGQLPPARASLSSQHTLSHHSLSPGGDSPQKELEGQRV